MLLRGMLDNNAPKEAACQQERSTSVLNHMNKMTFRNIKHVLSMTVLCTVLCVGKQYRCILLSGVLSRPMKDLQHYLQLSQQRYEGPVVERCRSSSCSAAPGAASAQLAPSCTELSSCLAVSRFGRPWQRGLTPGDLTGMQVMAVSGLQFAASRFMRSVAKQSARYVPMHPDSRLWDGFMLCKLMSITQRAP